MTAYGHTDILVKKYNNSSFYELKCFVQFALTSNIYYTLWLKY